MAPVRVRGCAGVSLPLGIPGSDFGKPMPGAGETAHVRRLFVDRSRCALEVSPAPRRVQMSLMTGRRAVVAYKSGETLSRRMWGRRPGRPDGWHAIAGGPAVIGGSHGAAPGVRQSPGSPSATSTYPSPSCRTNPPAAQSFGQWRPTTEWQLVTLAAKVLFPMRKGPTNRAGGAREDPASDGYTHIQASRGPGRTGPPAEGG